MAVDKQNNVWVAEKSYHCICKIPPTSAYLDFPAYFDVPRIREARGGVESASERFADVQA